MTVFGFNNRRDAENLSHFSKTMNFERGRKIGAPEGHETILVKAPSDGIDAKASGQCSSAQCFVVHITEDGEVVDNTEEVEVWNFTEEDVEANAYISCFRFRESWVFDGGGTGGPVALERVKFKLNAPLYDVATGFNDGNVAATVIDPMNSGLATGDTIQVYDFQKQFEFTQTDSIGIAVKSYYGWADNVSIWHIESCTQLVKRAKIDMSGDVAPWYDVSGVPAATFTQSMSDWPHVLWATSRDYEGEGGRLRESLVEGIGQPVANLKNPHNFAAASGWAIVERRPSDAVTQSPDNQTNPYNVTEVQDWEWHIVDVENEVAQYAKTKFLAGSFVLDIQSGDDFASGVSPLNMDEFANNDPANPANTIWGDFTDRTCHVPSGTHGWAALNKNNGKYQTIMTLSALFGKGEVVKAVADFVDSGDDLIYTDPADECGEFRHKNLFNLIVFGDKSATADVLCKLELDPVPDPVVDTFANASDVEVVTGVIINANGDLEMERSTIKACESAGANQTIALTSMDVVNDVYCSNNLLTKDYSEIKFLGSTVSSSTGVDLPCTNPANYNWETIFNNYIWNQNWYSISYYDINFPEGCFPCPTGCCTQTLYDGSTNQVYPLTDSDCTATVNPSPSQPTDVVSVSWAEGECDDPPSGGCNGTYISGFSIGGFGGVSGCSATFTQTGTALISGGTATINGNWSGVAGGMPQGSVAGTFTFTTDGTNHSASGALPSAWGGGTVSVSNTGTCTGTYQGSASLSGGNFPCGNMTNGTHDFTLT